MSQGKEKVLQMLVIQPKERVLPSLHNLMFPCDATKENRLVKLPLHLLEFATNIQ
jgi:hypothetical protein